MELRPPLAPDEARSIIVAFVRDYVKRSGAGGIVVGLSGGVDSTLVAALCAEAVGRERVTGLLLPEKDSSPEDERFGAEAARALGIGSERIDVSGIIAAATDACPHRPTGKALANLKARARMLVLFSHANRDGRLVAGTGNKSELLTGYFTKFGDGASDLLPIGDLYKTQVFALARAMRLPETIVARPPTAGLWAGQTDEVELGIRYQDLDRILYGLELELGTADIAARTGLPETEVRRIAAMVESTWHKRTTPLVPKIGHRTVGIDWRASVTGRTTSSA
ncbi:MAG: NAD+ synthase [Methanobacteriota archaeon]